MSEVPPVIDEIRWASSILTIHGAVCRHHAGALIGSPEKTKAGDAFAISGLEFQSRGVVE